jgi:hypothetical protein
MAEIAGAGGDQRTHIQSPLMRESLMDRSVLAAADAQQVIPILPDVHVVHIGGASILDRGRDAILPLLREVVRCRKNYKIILGVGGGTRMRHTYHIALDLGIPVGGLAMVAGAVNEQNRYMIQALLARRCHLIPLWAPSIASGRLHSRPLVDVRAGERGATRAVQLECTPRSFDLCAEEFLRTCGVHIGLGYEGSSAINIGHYLLSLRGG